MRLGYLVHDINDSAAARRVGLFAGEGVGVTLGGFRRLPQAPAQISGAPVHDLGLTADARLKERATSVLSHWLRPARVAAVTRGADAIVARNLEMLILASRTRRHGQRLVYECLDIHRLMLGDGVSSRALRAIERRLLAKCDLLLISSPAFLSGYFQARQGWRGDTLLVENKVPAGAMPPTVPAAKPAGPPWKIGWFGMLRCKKTLAQLGEIARRSDGAIEVLIAGIPSPAEFPDFPGAVAAMPGLRYVGPYTAADLPNLYAQTHVIWCIDYFEEGLNSAWLLPNRLYEGLANRTVPIAFDGVETGRWLERNGAGLRFADPVPELLALLAGMTPERYSGLLGEVDAVHRDAIFQVPAERAAIANRIAGKGLRA